MGVPSNLATFGCMAIDSPVLRQILPSHLLIRQNLLHGCFKVVAFTTQDPSHRLHNGPLFNCTSCDGWQQRCVQKVVPRADQRHVIFLHT